MNTRAILQVGSGVAVGILIGILLTSEETAAPLPTSASSLSPAASAIASNASATSDVYPVLKVVDGDTLVVRMNGESVTLRLIGLDTPETVDPRKPVQCFGKEASAKAKEMLTGKSVRLEMDSSQGELDKYGRTLAYIFLPDGTLFNKYMIAEGYGHEYTYNLPYKYQSEFKEAERQAREEKKGLWAEGVCANDGFTKPIISPNALEANTGEHDCLRNAYNCSNFKSQAEAQSVFDSCGGSANDVHKLDSDGDGHVCESLP